MAKHNCFCGGKEVMVIQVGTIAGPFAQSLCIKHLVALVEDGAPCTPAVRAMVDGAIAAGCEVLKFWPDAETRAAAMAEAR